MFTNTMSLRKLKDATFGVVLHTTVLKSKRVKKEFKKVRHYESHPNIARVSKTF